MDLNIDRTLKNVKLLTLLDKIKRMIIIVVHTQNKFNPYTMLNSPIARAGLAALSLAAAGCDKNAEQFPTEPAGNPSTIILVHGDPPTAEVLSLPPELETATSELGASLTSVQPDEAAGDPPEKTLHRRKSEAVQAVAAATPGSPEQLAADLAEAADCCHESFKANMIVPSNEQEVAERTVLATLLISAHEGSATWDPSKVEITIDYAYTGGEEPYEYKVVLGVTIDGGAYYKIHGNELEIARSDFENTDSTYVQKVFTALYQAQTAIDALDAEASTTPENAQ